MKTAYKDGAGPLRRQSPLRAKANPKRLSAVGAVQDSVAEDRSLQMGSGQVGILQRSVVKVHVVAPDAVEDSIRELGIAQHHLIADAEAEVEPGQIAGSKIGSASADPLLQP
jgi:hypothetical protein